MKKTIHKINNLVNTESFLQINYAEGYKYVDKAGELVNAFHDENRAPDFSMDITQLTIRKPDTEMEEIKITPHIFWGHFVSPDSLNRIATCFENDALRVLKILETQKISRLGWRNYFIYEFCGDKGEQIRKEVFSKFLIKDEFNFESTGFSQKFGDITFNFRLKKVAKNGLKTIPALLIDVDVFKQYDKFLEPKKLKSELKDFREQIQSNTFLKILNLILYR